MACPLDLDTIGATPILYKDRRLRARGDHRRSLVQRKHLQPRKDMARSAAAAQESVACEPHARAGRATENRPPAGSLPAVRRQG